MELKIMTVDWKICWRCRQYFKCIQSYNHHRAACTGGRSNPESLACSCYKRTANFIAGGPEGQSKALLSFEILKEVPLVPSLPSVETTNSSPDELSVFSEVEDSWNSSVSTTADAETAINELYESFESLGKKLHVRNLAFFSFIKPGDSGLESEERVQENRGLTWHLRRRINVSYHTMYFGDTDSEGTDTDTTGVEEEDWKVAKNGYERPDAKTETNENSSNQCNACNMLFSSRWSLTRHWKRWHDGKSGQLVCKKCDKIFPLRIQLRRHILQHGNRNNNSRKGMVGEHDSSDKKPVIDANSTTKILTASRLRAKENPSRCKTNETLEPKTRFKKVRSKLRQPVQTKAYFTSAIPPTLTRSVRQAKHLSRIQSLKKSVEIRRQVQVGKDFKCRYCPLKYRSRSGVHRHQAVAHCKSRNFSCEKCSYKTHRMDSLKRHSLVHSDLPAYRCILCKIGCKRKDALKRHYVNVHFLQWE